MKRKNVISAMCAVMMLMIAMVFVGCAAEEAQEGPDPNIGLYIAQSVSADGEEYDIDEVYDEGTTMAFELQDGGNGLYIYNEKDSPEEEPTVLTWKRRGNDISLQGGQVKMEGTVENGVLIINNLMDTGFDFRFVCEELVNGSK